MPGSFGRGAGELKVTLIVRGELRLTAGKAIVQAAHAAVGIVEKASSADPRRLARWLETGQKMVALTVPTLDEMNELHRKARAAGIIAVWVDDAGRTEVAPGTRTCLGLGPASDEELGPITDNLPLL